MSGHDAECLRCDDSGLIAATSMICTCSAGAIALEQIEKRQLARSGESR